MQAGRHGEMRYIDNSIIRQFGNLVAARGPTFSPVEINMKGHFIFYKIVEKRCYSIRIHQ